MNRTAGDLQEVAAMNARTYAMSDEDRDQWYREHPVSMYQEALDLLDGDKEAA